jgi:FMN phosphatase YigB (HAD superfamily)
MSSDAVECLLLDVGKVLIDLNYQDLAHRMLALTGLGPAQLQKMLREDGLVERFETGKMQGAQFYEEICRRTGTRISWPEFLAIWNSILGPPLVPEELIAALARKVRLWIISNTNELHFDFMTRHYAFPRHCEGFVLSHEVGVLKPDARIFTHAVAKMQVDPSRVLFADDQEVNVKAAQDLGICAFQCRDSGQFSAELKLRGVL